jgi:hypothetical protein
MQPIYARCCTEDVKNPMAFALQRSCPICGWEGGFHDDVVHARHVVPRECVRERGWLATPATGHADNPEAVMAVDYMLTNEMCSCPGKLVNCWHHPERDWEIGSVIDENADPDADATRFCAGGYDGWMVQCPVCGQVYAGGTSMPGGDGAAGPLRRT